MTVSPIGSTPLNTSPNRLSSATQLMTGVSAELLLDNVMVYWLTNSAASSAKLYWESFSDVNLTEVGVPTGISVFPKEIFRTSRRWAEKRFGDLRYFNTLDEGGHFAALEQPEVFVAEVRAAFAEMR